MMNLKLVRIDVAGWCTSIQAGSFTMRSTSLRAVAGVAAALICLGGAVSTASAATTPYGFSLVTVGAYGGEPSIGAGPSGELYDTTPSGGTIMYRSTDQGQTWTQTGTADKNSGDDCVATDQSGAIYLCNLAGSPSTAPLQADAWKSVDDGRTWTYGNNSTNAAAGTNLCGTSCNPFGVDRDWMDASIPRGGTTSTANVLLMYHDFYGPSQIWVNVSHDGGKTYGMSQDILSSLTPADGEQGLVTLADDSCSTVPIGAAIAKSGPHLGRMYVAWIASDPESAATGCNLSQAQAFHTVFVAWSDDNGATWTPQLAYDAGIGHDASTPFASFALDDKGNPYIGITTQAPDENPETCAAESVAGSEGGDPTCAYHMWVIWSADGGTTWDGGGGMFPGTAAQAYEVDPGTAPQTDVFPTIAAGDPGMVDVSWLGTNETEPTGPLGKFNPGGCAGPGPGNGNPTTYPPACKWNLYAAQSLNLTQPVGKATWNRIAVTPAPMHIGDICNLGIACQAPSSNRNLLDFTSEVIDPTTGYAHIAYADDNTINKLRAANQVSGPTVFATQTQAQTQTKTQTQTQTQSGTQTPLKPKPKHKPKVKRKHKAKRRHHRRARSVRR